MTSTHVHDVDHLPRSQGREAAHACVWYLTEASDVFALVDATAPSAAVASTSRALAILAEHHQDLPPDLQMRLLAHYCAHLNERARFGLYKVLCELADDRHGLAEVDGYADQWREEDDVVPDVHTLLDTTEHGFDETLRLMLPAAA